MFACCFQVMQGGNAGTNRDRLTGACSGMRGQAEANRLWKRLVGFPTGEQQDAELLEGGGLDWRERVIVRFRMLRKQALRHAVERIR